MRDLSFPVDQPTESDGAPWEMVETLREPPQVVRKYKGCAAGGVPFVPSSFQ